MTDLRSFVAEWLDSLTQKSLTDHTIGVYSLGVRQFVTWLDAHHPEISTVDQVTTQHVGDFLTSYRNAGRADGTIRLRGIALKKFFDYLIEENAIESNPTRKMKLPVPVPPRVEIVTDDQWQALKRTMTGATFRDRRDLAIFRLMRECGLRRGEICNLTVADVDFERSIVKINKTKYGKSRIVGVSADTRLALRKYLRERDKRSGADTTDALFIAMRMNRRTGYKLHGDVVHQIVKYRCGKAGLPTDIHPHSFRHTAAAWLIGAGMSDVNLDAMMGWDSPMMSRRYGAAAKEVNAAMAFRRIADDHPV